MAHKFFGISADSYCAAKFFVLAWGMSEKLLRELLSLKLQLGAGRLTKVHLIREAKKKLRSLKIEEKK